MSSCIGSDRSDSRIERRASTQLPERAIDYLEKYMPHLSDEDFRHVQKIISLSFKEGEISGLKQAYRLSENPKNIRENLKHILALSKTALKDMCLFLKIHYNEFAHIK